jgi:hypothetical protein
MKKSRRKTKKHWFVPDWEILPASCDVFGIELRMKDDSPLLWVQKLCQLC